MMIFSIRERDFCGSSSRRRCGTVGKRPSRAALTAERQKARREEQDYAAVRRNVEEFLSPPRQAPARQKDMELE